MKRNLIMLIGLIVLGCAGLVWAQPGSSGLFTYPISELDKSLDALDLANFVVAINLDARQLAHSQQLLSGYQRSRQQGLMKFESAVTDAGDQLKQIREKLLSGGWPKSSELDKFNKLLYTQLGSGSAMQGEFANRIVEQFRMMLRPEQRAAVAWETPEPVQGPGKAGGNNQEQQAEKRIVDLVLSAVDNVRYSALTAYMARRNSEAERVLRQLQIPRNDPSYQSRMNQLQRLFSDARKMNEQQYKGAGDYLSNAALQIFGDTLPQAQLVNVPIIMNEAHLRQILLSPGAPTVLAARLAAVQAQPPQ